MFFLDAATDLSSGKNTDKAVLIVRFHDGNRRCAGVHGGRVNLSTASLPGLEQYLLWIARNNSCKISDPGTHAMQWEARTATDSRKAWFITVDLSTMHSIPGFSITETLLSDRTSVLLRARRGGRSFLLRVLRESHLRPDEQARFRYCYEFSRHLEFPGIAKVVELTRGSNGPVLVMEDFGGVPLRNVLADGKLSVPHALRIALHMANVLGQLHLRHIIYKGLNPSNVLVHPETQEVRIANFDLASRISSENPGFSTQGLPEELAYVSPEQTGRMNRSVDYRTDLYSLGVTLYEMLTGQSLFHGQDALKLVYSHLAVEPPAPHDLRAELPPTLSAMVLKLLAKNAEDRYQSAYGLSVDLKECLRQWEATGTVTRLQPGQWDVSASLRLPQKLYGREREVARMSEALKRVTAGARAELLLVSGYSGVGKTSLVHELHRPLTRNSGFYTSGKFDALQRAPYSAWIQAFDALFQQLLSQDEAQIAGWKKVLLEALGTNASVLTSVVPRLELIIGRQPPMSELNATEAQKRFHWVFQRLMESFARRAHPFVLFLDDLQWADASSLNLFQHLLSVVGSRCLLVIGAYRDNEVGVGHPLRATLRELQNSSALVGEISLRPLEMESVQQLLADTVARPRDPEVDALATLVFQTTQGNPFFVGQFITSLHARDLLSLDPEEGRWRWSLERIRAEAITDNVVSLMAERLRELPVNTQEVLKRAACVGNRFTLELLEVISEHDARQLIVNLWEAIQQGLVLPIGETYKHIHHESDKDTRLDVSGVWFEFLHDRVQEAAYSLMSKEDRKMLHLRIGRRLLQSIPSEQREERIFDIVHQLDRAVDLIDIPAQREELAALNLTAGTRAKGSSAYAEALGYLQTGTSLLREDCWETQYELALPLHRHRAECIYLLGRMDEADREFQMLLSRARAPHEKGEIYLLLMDLSVSRGHYMEAIHPVREGLKVLGLEMPEAPDEVSVAISQEWERWQTNLAHREIRSFANLPETKDMTERMLILLLSRAIPTVFYLYPDLYHLASLMLANRAHERGHAAGSAYGYAALAVTLAESNQHVLAFEFSQLALLLGERYDPKRELPMIQFICGAFVNPWCRPYTTNLPLLQQSFQGCMDVGLFFWGGLSSMQLGVLAHLGGEDLDTQFQRLQWHLDFHLSGGAPLEEFVRQVGTTMLCILRLKHGAIPPDSPPYFDTIYLAENMHNPSMLALCYTLWLRTSYLLGSADLQQMLEKATAHIARLPKHVGRAEFWFYQGLALATLPIKASLAEEERRERQLDENIELLRGYSTGCPENFLQKYLLLAAERARLAQHDLKAMRLYDEALAAAVKAGQSHEEGLINERAARFHLAGGRHRIARSFLEDARAAYERWGASAKVIMLEREFPQLQRSVTSPMKGGGSDLAGLDLTAVLKASQALSGEIILTDLLEKLMSIILETAGARRGLLLLEGSHPLVVEARQNDREGSTVQFHPSLAEDHDVLPRTLVRYVERTGERMVLHEAARQGAFRDDPYVLRQHIRSVLCLRIVSPRQPLGTLYLENNLVGGAFTPERCKMLEVLSTQAAISLENARLYDTLEQRVRERTRELHTRNEELFQALKQLEQTQAQLVLQGKLASLGTLASGIAHELKNPLNFINNFAALSVEMAKELSELLDVERDRLEGRFAEQLIELSTTLRENTARINEHGKRADAIICSMLNLSHSRSDAAQTEVDLNTLVNQFTQMAYQAFQAQTPAFSASLVTRFDTGLPRLAVSPPELGRVIINLVNNSCYALALHAKASGDRFLPEIRVSTQDLGEDVVIRIRDNGEGIPASIRDKIFTPFFTTKPPGQGTGLGLSISHEIIVQEHGGRLEVTSEEGQFTEFVIRLPKRAWAAKLP
jgi:histidine kinase